MSFAARVKAVLGLGEAICGLRAEPIDTVWVYSDIYHIQLEVSGVEGRSFASELSDNDKKAS